MREENMFMKDHHLIIGAGPIGLASAKSLKLANIPYHQIEADNEVGGNWYHGVYETANILSSRKATEYPDFPMPKNYPDFPSGAQMLAYYKTYTDHYQLRENIQFNTKVVWVTPTDDNLWLVCLDNGEKRIYKGVLVCNGHHWSKKYPTYEGEFNGETFHSKDYKSPEQLRGKRVLVIGAGNSAFDISSECARVSKKCYLSVRRGIWVFPKTFMGKPLTEFKVKVVPNWMKRRLAKLLLKLVVGSHEDYGFPKPTIGIFDRHPTINTDTLINIKNGRISVKVGVHKFTGSEVEFSDGSKEEIDTIVYATGFKVDFPFLPSQLSRVENNSIVKAYGYGMYDDYKGLYIIGWFQPRGGVGSLAAPYANLLAKMINVQDEFETPLGMALKEIGEKLPDTHLFGDIDFLNWINKKEKQLNKIKKIGLKLDKRNGEFKNKVIEEKEPSGKKIKVY